MKAIHVITRLGRDCGGPVRSVQGLVAALEANGVETWLLSMKTPDKPWLKGVKHYRTACAVDFAGYKRAMNELIDEVKPDIVHLHNIWNPDIHAAAVVCRQRGIPYISAPRGSLEPWSLHHKWLKKKLAMWLYQRRDLNASAAIQATAEKERNNILKLGFKPSVFIAPNGVNTPTELPKRNLHADGFRRVLFMSRIHTQKGILEFAEAWGRVRPKGWKFEIAGFDKDGSLGRAMEIAERGGYANDFIFSGPLKDDAKWEAYARADVFVLPSYSENFGIVVAEALYAGVPVITTTGAPWGELKTNNCGWWSDLSVDNLAADLAAAVALSDEEREVMGMAGAKLIKAKYTWGAIAAKTKEVYETLVHG